MKLSDTTHPSHDDLFAYLAGRLNAVQSASIEAHLNQCESCCELLSAAPTEDTIDSMLRQKESDTSISPEAPPTQDDSPREGGIAPTIVPESDEKTRPPRDGVTAIPGLDAEAIKLPPELREHPRYRIVEWLGHGGMGDVFRAEHKVMNRPVALKVIKPQLVQNDAAVRRFRREVQAAARLHHPNIVTAFDAEQAGDLHYLVMEFVDGVDLDEVIRERGALPITEAVEYIRQAAEGLQHAHELGMVHRDIKPHNLMVTGMRSSEFGMRNEEDDSAIHVPNSALLKILDFGLANFANEVAEDVCSDRINAVDEPDESGHDEPAPGASILHQLTQIGTMMGTPDYIAPEQAQDAHTADIRADIYSLGCTFYTLLTGRVPFGEGSVLDKVKAHQQQEPPPLSEVRDDVPAEVEAVVQKMMAKDPTERYQTPAEVADALTDEGRIANPSTRADARISNPSYRRRRPLVLTAAATLFLAVIAVVVFYIQTDNGVVRVEVTDPSLEVTISGQTITSSNAGKPLTIRAGEQKLIVRQNDSDFELITDSFQLRRGDHIALKVELVPGQVVVQKDGAKFDSATIESSDSNDLGREVVVRYTTSKEGPEIRLQGESLGDPQRLFNKLRSLIERDPNLVVRLEGEFDPLARDFEQLNTLIAAAGVVHVNLPDNLREERTKAMERSLKARDRYPREASLREIGIALKRHCDQHGVYPPWGDASNFDTNGRPHLSWRVHLLPQLGESELFQKFRLDEAWDSPNNEPLLWEMPAVFKTTEDPTKTTLLAVVGEGAAYEGGRGLSPDSFHDGLSNTGFLVDVGNEKAVPWTKPENTPFEPNDPIRPFGGPPFLDEFLVLLADGSVQAVSNDIAPSSLRALFTRAAGDKFDENAKRTTPLPGTKESLKLLYGHGRAGGGLAEADQIDSSTPKTPPEQQPTANQPPSEKAMIEEAASIPLDEWEKLSTSNNPLPSLVTGSPLSLVLTLLNPAEAAKTNPKVLEDFRYLKPGIPKATEMAQAMSHSSERGYVSMLQRAYILKVDTTSRQPKNAETGKSVVQGTIDFEAPQLYAGRVQFTAEVEGQTARVTEFRLPNYDITIRRDEKGVWQR